jgi:hypothetical protein
MVIGLYEKCLNYQKLAGDKKISVEKNSNTTLQELSDIKDFKDRIKFAKDQDWKFLGEGSSRTVFQINDELIIKIAHAPKGIAQNMVEMRPEVQTECVNNAVVADAKGKWIIFRTTKKLSKDDFKKIVGFGFEAFMNALFYAMNNESDKNKPKDYDEIKHNKLFLCLANLVFENQLLVGDIDKPSSWGLLDGKPVLRDAGLDKETFKKFYDDSKSSSKSS